MIAPIQALATGPEARIAMPFAGKWSSFVDPATHNVYFGASGTGWATDIYAPPDTAVQANVAASTGSVTFVVKAAGPLNCATAGDFVLLAVNVDGAEVGTVLYEHLDRRTVNKGDSFGSGTVLGYTKLWEYNRKCWRVRSDSGVHTHFEASGCYIDRAQGTELAASSAISVVGGGYRPKKCPANLPPVGDSLPPAGACWASYYCATRKTGFSAPFQPSPSTGPFGQDKADKKGTATMRGTAPTSGRSETSWAWRLDFPPVTAPSTLSAYALVGGKLKVDQAAGRADWKLMIVREAGAIVADCTDHAHDFHDIGDTSALTETCEAQPGANYYALLVAHMYAGKGQKFSAKFAVTELGGRMVAE